MFVRLLITWAVTAIAFGITAWLLDGMTINGGVAAYLWVSLLFGLVNMVVGTILRIISIPLIVITLGIILIFINAIVLEIVDALSTHLDINKFFWTAVWASIILSVVTVILNVILNIVFKPKSA